MKKNTEEKNEGFVQEEFGIAITADMLQNVVMINFGTEISFLGLSAEDAISLGQTLIEKAYALS